MIIICFWSCRWEEKRRTDPAVAKFVRHLSTGTDVIKFHMTQEEMLEAILEGQIQGLVHFNARLKREKWEEFAEVKIFFELLLQKNHLFLFCSCLRSSNVFLWTRPC